MRTGMADQTHEDLAARAGADPAYVARLVDLGILPGRSVGAIGVGDIRRIRVVQGLEAGGIPLEVIGEAMRQGAVSLEFVEQPAYDRFAADSDLTFRELSDRHGIPMVVLVAVREAMGFPPPGPDDRVRETELDVVPLLERLAEAGIGQGSVEQQLRVAGDGMRRIAETEAHWWRTEILEPLYRTGADPGEIGRRTEAFGRAVGPLTDEALVAIFHGQQSHAWMRNILEGFEGQLAQAGLLDRLERTPAICFYDVTGYTRLTEEQGDAHAADLAGRVARLVQRVALERGGKVVKWLGDGIMFHFPEPTPAVLAALDMLDAAAADGLPSGHAGVHAGPVLFQEGDYFGRTVNGAARIADHAHRGQVLVSTQVVEASDDPGLSFKAIGPVPLEGLLEPLILHEARRSDT